MDLSYNCPLRHAVFPPKRSVATTGVVSTQLTEEEAAYMDMVEGNYDSALEKMAVVVTEAVDEVVKIKNSLMVWILAIVIYIFTNKEWGICPVGRGVSCNRVLIGNMP